MPLARFDNGRFFWTRPAPAGVVFDSATFVGPFLYASSGMDVWRTAFREPRAAWTRLLTVELEDPYRGRPRKLGLQSTETDLYACGYVQGGWSVVHIREDGRAGVARHGLADTFATATRFYEESSRYALGLRIYVRGAGDTLLEVHTVERRSVLVARPGSDSVAVPLPDDVDARMWSLPRVADDVIVLMGAAGGDVHYRPSTQLAASHAGPRDRLRYPLSPRLFLGPKNVGEAFFRETFFRSMDPDEPGLPLPVRVCGYQCRVVKDDGPRAIIAVQEDSNRDGVSVHKNAHCTVVRLGHVRGDVSGDYIAGAAGRCKLALFWHVPLETSLDILLGAGRERDASASNFNLVHALRLGTVRVLLGLLLGA